MESIKSLFLACMIRAIYTIVLFSLLFACREKDSGFIPFDPEAGWFPATPLNISQLNTRFDEYSSHIRGSGGNIHIYYSTNYENKGAHFDIDGAILNMDINEDQNKMSLSLSYNKPQYADRLLPLINSQGDEHGPLSFTSKFGSETYFFYAHNRAGQYEIEYTCQQGSHSDIKGPFNAAVLNSSVCDFYPTIDKAHTQMVFSSFRGRKYDIYEIQIEGNNLIQWLNTGTNAAKLNTTLSSDKDDRCPCIKGNLMVLASDREGGYGGYDLWYSVLKNGQWGKPVNFGPEINSQYDEFSPAVEYYPESNNDFMLFSSNRPGGKSGYDLYYVGIPKLID